MGHEDGVVIFSNYALYQRMWNYQFKLFTFHSPTQNSINVQRAFTAYVRRFCTCSLQNESFDCSLIMSFLLINWVSSNNPTCLLSAPTCLVSWGPQTQCEYYKRPPNRIISFLEIYKQLIHCIILFPFFLKYLTNTEYVISSQTVASESTLMVPNNLLCIWN